DAKAEVGALGGADRAVGGEAAEGEANAGEEVGILDGKDVDWGAGVDVAEVDLIDAEVELGGPALAELAAEAEGGAEAVLVVFVVLLHDVMALGGGGVIAAEDV